MWLAEGCRETAVEEFGLVPYGVAVQARAYGVQLGLEKLDQGFIVRAEMTPDVRKGHAIGGGGSQARGINVDVREGVCCCRLGAPVWEPGLPASWDLSTRRTNVGHGREQLGQRTGPGGLGAREESVGPRCRAQKGDSCGQNKTKMMPPPLVYICAPSGRGGEVRILVGKRINSSQHSILLVFL